MYPLLLVLCLFFSAQVLIQPIHATRSHYRMVLDYSKVFCTGPLPKRTFGEITQNWSIYNTRWSHLNFTSLADLCSAHGNPQGNMGGMVSYTQTPSLPPPLSPSFYLSAYIHLHLVPPIRQHILRPPPRAGSPPQRLASKIRVQGRLLLRRQRE